MRVVGHALSAGDLAALRAGRYVPLFGLGAGVDESRRALAVLRACFARDADPRATEHARTLLEHPQLGAGAYGHLSSAILSGDAPAWNAPLALGAALVLGADDGLRGRVADSLELVPRMRPHCEISAAAGGGTDGAWRDHYLLVCRAGPRSAESERAVIRAMRAWYECVLARRWSGLDHLRGSRASLPPLGQWLVDSARWLVGDDGAREALTEGAEALLAPVHHELPGLAGVVARELTELLATPLTARWNWLCCAASRDHAAMAIRHWLRAASEAISEFEDSPERSLESLGPEPSRAGRAAAESSGRAEDFILDWYVPDRAPRRAIDAWAASALRLWHRLHGAAMLGRAIESMGDVAAPGEAGA